jgi:ABC-2 type transport system ATP-binding protein
MLEVKKLSKSFGKKQVLRPIDISLENGVYGLLGPNGAGKTTLIRCLTGIYTVPKNTVLMDGVDLLGQKNAASNLGYLPQTFGALKGLTASEMLCYFAESKRIPRKQQKEEIKRCLELVGLADKANDKIRTFSGGMVRRLGIAQAIMGDPKLVILDEPTAGLDPEERLRFKNLVAALPRDKIIILSTHIVEDVVALCDHIIILSKGAVAAEGTTDEIASFAAGHVFTVPCEQEGTLSAPHFIAQRGETTLRVISSVAQPGVQMAPTVEDGYLYTVRDNL